MLFIVESYKIGCRCLHVRSCALVPVQLDVLLCIFLAFVPRLRATMTTERITVYEPHFPVDPAMSHEWVLYYISGEVLWWLTTHPWQWWMDVHFRQCSSKNPCPCCLARKASRARTAMSHTCELCSTAWRLSAVSWTMSSCVAASGRNYPRLSEYRSLYSLEKQRARLVEERGLAGYQPHWYGWQSSWSEDEWDWHGWQDWNESSSSPPPIPWPTVGARTPATNGASTQPDDFF